jgi:hypothetical protein
MARRWGIALIPALASLAAAGWLTHGALATWPAFVRLVLGFSILVLAPGLAWRRAIGAPGPGGAWLACGWALGYGVAWLGLGVLLTRILGLPFTVLAAHGAPWSALPWLAAGALAPERASSAPLGRMAALAIGLAALAAALHVARTGPPITWASDSPDHIGTIRRMLAEGEAFPTDAFFRDAGPTGADPRKGLWHPGVALVCALSGVDPLPAWRGLAVLLAPLFVLNAAGFAFRFGGGFGAAVGAWALLLGYGGGLGAQYLAEAVFATKIADQLALATIAALLLDLDRKSTRSRIAVAGLVLGTILVHVFGALQFAIVFGALGVGLLVRDRGRSATFARLLATSLACAAVVAPYLAWRALQSYAPVNVLHTETQGMLEVTPGIWIVSFGTVWDWLGPTALLFPLSLLAWARASRETGALLLLTTTLAVGALLFLPPLVALLEPRLGYLLMRFTWLLPASGAAAFLATAMRDAWRSRRRRTAVAAGGVLALAFAGPLADGVRAAAHDAGPRPAQSEGNVERWADALAWMDRELPTGTVVLADPATSYSVPMLTRHWVSTLVDQHSSPNDPHALERMLDARDALDPFAPWSRTAEVVRRWGVTAIALNGRFDEPAGLDIWAPSAEWYTAARSRLERAPQAFHRVFESDRFTVYTIDRAALDALDDGGTPRPFVRVPDRDDRGRSMGQGLPELVAFHVSATEAARGDTLVGSAEWRAASALPAGAYRVGVRFDRALPADVPRAPGWVSKPWRKLVERVRGERYRFRSDHLPVNGAYGVDRWSPGEVVQDTFRITVPHDVAPGDYVVRVSISRQPHYPNLRLRDITSDDDYLNGREMARLQISRERGQ